jgi:5-hydroxyisourate hydrolase/2-oxo-4-hydroxy-4-carboxy-5-ureidoimidazoline decarboxylase
VQARFSNRPGDEIRVAAAEQQKITELRLRNLKAWEVNSGNKLSPVVNEPKNAHTAGAVRPPITTHVLDVSLGVPGVGIDVLLEKSDTSTVTGEDTNSFTGDGFWSKIGSSVTNSDGRSGPLMANSNFLEAGRYRLTFKTGEYFLRTSKTKDGISGFYPYICVILEVKPSQVAEHFHVPLLIAPYSYTTYRGS